MTKYEESDEYCPNCDNHYVSHSCLILHEITVPCMFNLVVKVIDAKTPKQVVGLEAEDIRVDSR